MILLTGGMGFIGLHTARALVDQGSEVVITRFRATREPEFIKEHLGGKVALETMDVTDLGRVFEVMHRHQVESVVHLAVPGLGALTPAEDARVNIGGLINVLEASRILGVKRVSLASSVAVYAGSPLRPHREDDPLPIRSPNPTCAFKKSWEILGGHFAERTGIEVVALRIGGIYGPLYHSMANLPSRLVHAAVRGRDPDFAGARGGTPYREDATDLCYVKDCARGIALVHLAPALEHRVYNLSGGRPVTNGELAAAVERAVPGAHFELRSRPGEAPSPASLDISRVSGELGYEPAFPLDQAIPDYVAWLESHDE
ncbi:MAG: NAD(P)-dependent oxidoreductase [Acidimicrobiales bacterium]|nr:NAD(P)-dependent oxidoreductase [Acidimicrobiales bacterium]